LDIAGKAVNSIFHKPDSIFIKAKAKDIMFDGLPVDCTVTDFAGAAVCNVLETEAKDLVPDGEKRYKFSLFGGVRENSSCFRKLTGKIDDYCTALSFLSINTDL